MNATTKSALFTQYNKAIASGAFDRKRVNRALGLFQKGETRPYNTTITSCDCPDSARGNVCKHRIQKMLAYRTFEALLKTAQSVIVNGMVFVDGEQFPIPCHTAHKLTQKAGFSARTISDTIAYRRMN